MNAQNFTTAVIGLSIAVILVAGLMVPVISSLDDSGGGESGYTNAGEYYYKTPVAGENHAIYVSEDGSKAYISYDGTPLVTKDMGSDAWAIPLVLATSSDDTIVYLLTYYVDDGEQNIEIIEYRLNEHGQDGIISVPFTLDIEGTQIADYGSSEMFNVVWFISDSGDWTYTGSPTISPDQTIYGFQMYSDNSTDESTTTTRYVTILGMGTVEELGIGRGEDNEYGPGIRTPYEGNAWYIYSEGNLTGSYTLDNEDNWNPGDITVNTTETGDYVKLDDISLKLTWVNDDDPTDTVVETVTFNKFVVPVEVSGGGESGGSRMSDTLLSLISVIPLITVIGIVIGAVGYLRMKN